MIAIRVWITSEDHGKVLKPMFDPPPSSWKFQQCFPPTLDMGKTLEDEITDVISTFVGRPNNPQTNRALVIAIQNVLHRWQSNGWLTIEGEYQRL